MGAIGRRCFLIIEPIPNSRRVIIADDRLLDWIAVRIPHVGPDHNWHGRAHAIGVGLDGEILAAICISNVDKFGNGELAMAADTPRWATRDTIRGFLAYPFGQLGLRRLTTITAASNERALRFNRGMGFQQEGTMRFGHGDEDAIIMGLLREDAQRWLA